MRWEGQYVALHSGNLPLAGVICRGVHGDRPWCRLGSHSFMTALVRIALRRPYTFIVLALLLLIIGPLAASRTPVDIFPDIRIPVIGVVWQYTGLPPDQMAGRITTQFQRALTTTVNDIDHIVANSYNGVGIVKIFFQPNVDI